MNSGPRIHHYQYAHHFLPTIAWQHHKEVVAALVNTQAIGFLSSVWHSLGEQLPENERIEPRGLSCFVRRYGDFVIAVVELPPPMAVPEAFYTALVFGLNGNMRQDGLHLLPSRYFTLEVSYDWSSQEECTVLGEWTAEGEHLNHGTGPDPDPQAFLLKVCSLLEKIRGQKLQAQI